MFVVVVVNVWVRGVFLCFVYIFMDLVGILEIFGSIGLVWRGCLWIFFVEWVERNGR